MVATAMIGLVIDEIRKMVFGRILRPPRGRLSEGSMSASPRRLTTKTSPDVVPRSTERP